MKDNFKSIAVAAQAIRQKETTAQHLLNQALKSAAEHQALNAIAYFSAEAQQQAEMLDKKNTTGQELKKLHGIPVSIKDLFNVQNIPTQAGTKARLPTEFLNPSIDAVAVKRLREAGAIVFAKTNMHEIALGVTGENPVTGDVCNPHDPNLQAGGSSSGAAVAVAIGAGLAALGSDTGGSIRVPASFCGVVGFKPSFARVPLEGALHLSWTCDHAGPIVNTVEDARTVAEILMACELQATQINSPKQLRFGIPSAWLEGRLSKDVRQHFENALKQLKELDAEILEVTPAHLNEALEHYTTIVRCEAAHVHARSLSENPYQFGELVRPSLQLGLEISKKDYCQALLSREKLRAGVHEAMLGLDALLLPAAPTVAPKRGSQELLLESGMRSHRDAVLGLTLPFSLLGLPTLSLPFAKTNGLPIGLQVVGAMNNDAKVLAIGECLEKLVSLASFS